MYNIAPYSYDKLVSRVRFFVIVIVNLMGIDTSITEVDRTRSALRFACACRRRRSAWPSAPTGRLRRFYMWMVAAVYRASPRLHPHWDGRYCGIIYKL